MQLHKLLYLIQAANLAWFGEPAFEERIEAWQWGPVVRGVAGAYMGFKSEPIDEPISGNPNRLDDRTAWVVDRVVTRYADKDGPTLAKLVKGKGTPWRAVRHDLPDSAKSDREIPPSLIEDFHRRMGLTPLKLKPGHQRLAERFFEGDHHALEQLFERVAGVEATVEP